MKYELIYLTVLHWAIKEIYMQQGGFCTQKAFPWPPDGDDVWTGEGRQRHFSKRYRFEQFLLCKDHKGDIW